MPPTPCPKIFQALQSIDKLRGSENWTSWRLLVLANARALQLIAHIDGSAHAQSPLLPRAREAHARAESCARVLILGSIAPDLLLRLCELGLQDDASAADLMRWLHETVSPREAGATAHDDLARLIRIDRTDFPSMDAYGKEALNLWARIRHFWPGSANVVAMTAILEGMKQHNEHAYLGWRHFIVFKRGVISQQHLFDMVAALRDGNGVVGGEDAGEDVASTGQESSIYSRSSK